MSQGNTPAILLSRSVGELVDQLGGVREGAEEAIHQTRVAIRRVREALGLAHSDFSDEVVPKVEDRLRRASRSLGRVRDADIGYHLLQHLEDRFAVAPSALSRLRVALTAEQLRRRRKAAKKLAALELEALPLLLARGRRRVGRFRWRADSGEWRALLREQLALRADAVRAAVHHAGGIYFPNRVHSARVAIKQLRYTLELADLTSMWPAPAALRVLKKAQDALGETHDREVLLARLDALVADTADPARDEINALAHFIRSEAMSFHAKYLRWRPRILDVCDEATAATRPRRVPTRALVAAGLAIPSFVLLRNRILNDGSDRRFLAAGSNVGSATMGRDGFATRVR